MKEGKRIKKWLLGAAVAVMTMMERYTSIGSQEDIHSYCSERKLPSYCK